MLLPTEQFQLRKLHCIITFINPALSVKLKRLIAEMGLFIINKQYAIS